MAGGGVGEAMLIGAAVGAGTGGVMSAVKDEDPLQGALLGAALGAAGGGIGSWAGGAAAGSAGGAAGGATGGTTGGTVGGTVGGEIGGTVGGTAGASGGSLAGAGGATIPGVGTAAGMPIAGTTTAAVPGTTLASTGASAAPASWGAQGIGQGFAPALTNAQAYGAGIGGGITGLIGQSAQNQNNMAPEPEPYTGPLSYFKYSPQTFRPSVAPGYADGGIASLGPQTGMYPQSQYDKTQFATPSQMPISREVIGSDYDARINPYTGDMMMASGGISSLGSYSDGGRMLKGPGDGMSDDIPGVIADKQPARLADGEFVVPADVVSHLGNGSTDAGAKKLYSMMDNVRKARTGSKKQGRQIKADKYVPGMASGGEVENGIVKLAGGGEWTDPYLVPTTQGGFLDVGNANGVSADQVQAMIDATRKTTAGISSNFQPAGYGSNYYNLGYWQNQLPAAQAAYEAAQKPVEYGKMVGKDFDTLDLAPGTQVKWGTGDNWMYQTVGPDGKITLDPTTFGGDPAFGTVKQAYITAPDQAAIDAAKAKLDPIQANVSRLESSGIKYDPYTTSGRPSSTEPQFYGNIYRPEYQSFAAPDYMLAGNLGRWSNVSELNPTNYLQTNRDVAAAGLNPFQHYMDYGMKEGRPREFDAQAYLAQNPDVAASSWYQGNPYAHYLEYGRSEGRSPTASSGIDVLSGVQSPPAVGFNPQGYLAANPDVRAAGVDPFQHYIDYGMREGRAGYGKQQAQEAPKEPAKEEKKRRGGIASLVR